ncbi:MAG TPA: hypothetical protein VIK08_02240 [Candidatus Limnocylindrales bacterium]
MPLDLGEDVGSPGVALKADASVVVGATLIDGPVDVTVGTTEDEVAHAIAVLRTSRQNAPATARGPKRWLSAVAI